MSNLESKVKTTQQIILEVSSKLTPPTSTRMSEQLVEQSTKLSKIYNSEKWVSLEVYQKEIAYHKEAFGLLWAESCRLSEQIESANNILDSLIELFECAPVPIEEAIAISEKKVRCLKAILSQKPTKRPMIGGVPQNVSACPELKEQTKMICERCGEKMLPVTKDDKIAYFYCINCGQEQTKEASK